MTGDRQGKPLNPANDPASTSGSSTARSDVSPGSGSAEESTAAETTRRNSAATEGAGCFPAILAGTVLMGIVMFITFAFAAYVIFQKRGDLAIRTLRGTMTVELEQSRLAPETKQAVIERLNGFADELEAGKYEPWQAGGVMNRLIRSPLMRWGDLDAVDAWASTNLTADEYNELHKQVTRFQRAAELDRAVSNDIYDVLFPVTAESSGMELAKLKPVLVASEVKEVGVRAKLIADRAEVPDQVFEQISLPKMVDRLIETGLRDGST